MNDRARQGARAHKARRRKRAMAARLALSLCQAELSAPAWAGAGLPACAGRHRQPHISVLTARAALRAAGLPPHLAAAFRSRLRLVPEPEAKS